MTQKALILTYYPENHEKLRNYGRLGPQIAATSLTTAGIDTKVLGIDSNVSTYFLMEFIHDYFKDQKPIVGFSDTNQNLLVLAKKIKEEGGISIAGGPLSADNFAGEIDHEKYKHRFQGYSNKFSFALRGPIEQLIPYFIDRTPVQELRGTVYLGPDGKVRQNQPAIWQPQNLSLVDWNNMLYISEEGRIVPLDVKYAQVISHIGCPYAARQRTLNIKNPSWLSDGNTEVKLKGCAFCDIAIDKGSSRKIDLDHIIEQIRCLPEDKDRKKIDFELINEAPIPTLKKLLQRIKNERIRVSSIGLTTRADYLVNQRDGLIKVLEDSSFRDIGINLYLVGFENYDQRVLDNLGKGTTVEQNLEAVKILRELSSRYENFSLSFTQDNVSRAHGLITPTPWDTIESLDQQIHLMEEHNLFHDIHKRETNPLGIHHASSLGKWIRAIEEKTGEKLQRYAGIIDWTNRAPELLTHLVENHGFR